MLKSLTAAAVALLALLALITGAGWAGAAEIVTASPVAFFAPFVVLAAGIVADALNI